MNTERPIAAFISPHGFGHAARAAAVLEAVQKRSPGRPVKLFTTVPDHFFKNTLSCFTLDPIRSDVGIIQHDALRCDVEKTWEALDRFMRFDEHTISELSANIRDCAAVLCDISPLGIVVAARAKLPSILVENFTWDWIYRQHPLLAHHCPLMEEIFSKADVHVQTEPICTPKSGTVRCPPIFREIHDHPEEVKQKLGVAEKPVILISMGGIGYNLNNLTRFEDLHEFEFVIAGAEKSGRIADNIIGLAHDSTIYHPDLINTVDLVVCKAGYSTVAECIQAGTRLLCVDRKGFAESSVLSRFVRQRMKGTIIGEEEFDSGDWLVRVPALLDTSPPEAAGENGANIVADLLLTR